MKIPQYVDEESLDKVYIERAALVAQHAAEARQSGAITLAQDDTFKVAAFGIDCQVGFCTPGASLYVPGAVEDMTRALRWLYQHMERLTTLVFSLDTHHLYQIFHPAWWRDAQGNPPPPMTPITAQDVQQGRWIPQQEPEASLAYCNALESKGRYVLTIWPYHTLLGGVSHALVPAMMEAAIFHAMARGTQPLLCTKGQHPLTENYSVLSPEVEQIADRTVGRFDEQLFQTLLSHDRVYVFGEASSHCVLSTLRDLRDRIKATDPSLMDKIYILSDAMSPVPAPPIDPLPDSLNFPAIASQALEEFARDGMHLTKTTSPFE